MPAVAQSQPAQLPASVPRRPLTRLDCLAHTQAGLLDYERYELIA